MSSCQAGRRHFVVVNTYKRARLSVLWVQRLPHRRLGRKASSFSHERLTQPRKHLRIENVSVCSHHYDSCFSCLHPVAAHPCWKRSVRNAATADKLTTSKKKRLKKKDHRSILQRNNTSNERGHVTLHSPSSWRSQEPA